MTLADGPATVAGRVYAAGARAGALAPDGSMHLLGAVANCPEVAGATTRPPLRCTAGSRNGVT